MKKVKYDSYLNQYTKRLPKGVFLTTKSDGVVNTMTMGWGTTGFIWNMPVLMIPVRKSRYTHELLENSSHFTVSVPFSDKYDDDLIFCGSNSGRDINKIDELNLELDTTSESDVPIIKGNDLHFICEIKYQQDMDADLLAENILNKSYSDRDMHTIYYGKILSTYLEE